MRREELQQAGLHLLIGPDPETGNSVCSIGEAEIPKERLKHHKTKDFWVQVFVSLSQDENLTNAHVRYLAGRMIEDAITAGRFKVINVQSGGAKLPESDREDMAAVIHGGGANGLTAWRNKLGKTLKELEASAT